MPVPAPVVGPLGAILGVLRSALDLVLPRTCPGCGRPGQWCARCARALTAVPRRVRLSGPSLDAAVGVALPPVWALTHYGGPVRGAILAGKEAGRVDLPPLLGAVLGRALPRALGGLLDFPELVDPPGARPPALRSPVPVRAAAPAPRLPGPEPPSPRLPGPEPPSRRHRRGSRPAAGHAGRTVWLVPAPSRRAAARRRGEDPVEVMARAAARQLAAAGYAAGVAPCLYTARQAADSVGLSSAERVANLAGRIRVVRAALPSDPGPVVVLDDVITTGATLVGSTTALHGCGIRPAAFLAVAAAAPWLVTR